MIKQAQTHVSTVVGIAFIWSGHPEYLKLKQSVQLGTASDYLIKKVKFQSVLSSILVKSLLLIRHFIRVYLIPLPP